MGENDSEETGNLPANEHPSRTELKTIQTLPSSFDFSSGRIAVYMTRSGICNCTCIIERHVTVRTKPGWLFTQIYAVQNLWDLTIWIHCQRTTVFTNLCCLISVTWGDFSGFWIPLWHTVRRIRVSNKFWLFEICTTCNSLDLIVSIYYKTYRYRWSDVVSAYTIFKNQMWSSLRHIRVSRKCFITWYV